jgi:Holliday junction resolvase RusA-like endonuclease
VTPDEAAALADYPSGWRVLDLTGDQRARDAESRRAIVIVHLGDPQPQGSKIPMLIRAPDTKAGWRAGLRDDNSATLKAWRDGVISSARAVTLAGQAWSPLAGPLTTDLIFTMKRPASAPKTREIQPAVRPDVDKLERAVNDALKLGGVIADDSLIVDHGIGPRKVYPYDERWPWCTPPTRRTGSLRLPGVVIRVTQLP